MTAHSIVPYVGKFLEGKNLGESSLLKQMAGKILANLLQHFIILMDVWQVGHHSSNLPLQIFPCTVFPCIGISTCTCEYIKQQYLVLEV